MRRGNEREPGNGLANDNSANDDIKAVMPRTLRSKDEAIMSSFFFLPGAATVKITSRHVGKIT